MSFKEKNTIPGWLQTHEASNLLGLTDSQFRRKSKKILSVQLHKNGPRLYKTEDVLAWKEANGRSDPK